jgi:hypothetical protein
MALIETPGEKLLIRIWETAEKSGIGWLRPAQMRREGHARADVDRHLKLADAQARADVELLKSGRAQYDSSTGALKRLPAPPVVSLNAPAASGGVVVPRLGSALDCAGTATRDFAVREMTRAINLDRIVQQAASEADQAPDEAVSDEPINADWFARWRDNAQDVTDEDVQRLWARALAGEVKEPGKYSLRTLDFLRSVSKTEAELIAKLGPVSFGHFIYKDAQLLEARGFNYSLLSDYQTLGLIYGMESLGLHWMINAPKEGESFAPVGYVCNGVGVTVTSVLRDIRIPCYPLSALGKEILTLGQFEADRDFVRALVKFLSDNGAQGLLGQAVGIAGGMMNLEPPLEVFGTPAPAPPSSPQPTPSA